VTYTTAFKVLNEAIQSAMKEELPEYHPIVQMLWDKSRMAAKGMEEEQNSLHEFLAPEPIGKTVAHPLGKNKNDGQELASLETKIEEGTSMSI